MTFWPLAPEAVATGLRILWVAIGWELIAAREGRKTREWLASIYGDQEEDQQAVLASFVALCWITGWQVGGSLVYDLAVLLLG
jgi:hypothetical protein